LTREVNGLEETIVDKERKTRLIRLEKTHSREKSKEEQGDFEGGKLLRGEVLHLLGKKKTFRQESASPRHPV